MTLLAQLAAVLALWAPGTSAEGGTVVPCTSDDDCYLSKEWRCLPSSAPGAAPCTLDYQFNETGSCACNATGKEGVCTPLTPPPAVPGKRQYLVIGDSVSMGYFSQLKLNLSATHQSIHAPGNCDNANWGNRCLKGWLGPDPARWDIISMNWGLHDLAYPDNEHLSLPVYTKLLTSIFTQLRHLAPKATLLWVSTTPVPTNPPPQNGKPCTLIPGRLEKDVVSYNKAAAAVFKGIGSCDMHKFITDYCGVGYSTCDIAQCGGPHFPGKGFHMLGNAMAKCIRHASSKHV